MLVIHRALSVFQRVQRFLGKDNVLIAEGIVGVDEFTGGCSMVADDVFDIEDARMRFARALVVRLDEANGEWAEPASSQHVLTRLRDTLNPFRDGAARLFIAYEHQAASALISCGDGWCVSPREELLERLRGVEGLSGVDVRY